jgi:predicted dehydrogenase
LRAPPGPRCWSIFWRHATPLTRGGRFIAKRIRLGFIGAYIRATWAAQSHFPALLASPDVELTAVCTTRHETAEAAREAFGAKLAFTDFREMVVSKEIDAVAVADACCD